MQLEYLTYTFTEIPVGGQIVHRLVLFFEKGCQLLVCGLVTFNRIFWLHGVRQISQDGVVSVRQCI